MKAVLTAAVVVALLSVPTSAHADDEPCSALECGTTPATTGVPAPQTAGGAPTAPAAERQNCVTDEEFDQIAVGMPKRRVQRIVGTRGHRVRHAAALMEVAHRLHFTESLAKPIFFRKYAVCTLIEGPKSVYMAYGMTNVDHHLIAAYRE